MSREPEGQLMAGRCALVLSAAALLLMNTGCSRGEAKIDRSERRVPVVCALVEERQFEELLRVDGTVVAKTTVMVTPRVAGSIERLFVDEGAQVEAGETRLLAIDQLKLEKAVEVASQALAVARCGTLEKQANLERVEAVLHKAAIDYHRQRKLFEEEAIGTQDQVEQLESTYRQSQANLKHAQTLVALAREQERQTEAQLAMSQKDLRDAVVIAPVTGVISERYQEMGDMGSPGQPVFRIDSVDQLEVSVYLPARVYGRIEAGQTSVRVGVEGVGLGRFPVTFKSPTIDPAMRVFEVKCDLGAASRQVAPGALASVEVLLGTTRDLGVPREAVGRYRDGHAVFQVVEGRAVRRTIAPGLEVEGWVQLEAGDLVAGTRVVTEGRFLLEEGTAVSVREGFEDL
jgi:RND family efflux transporter MFP subunit